MVCDKSFFRVRNDRESLEFGTDGLGLQCFYKVDDIHSVFQVNLMHLFSSVPGHRSQLHPQVLPGHAGGSPGFVAQQQSSRNRLSADVLAFSNGCLKLKPCQRPNIRSPNMVSRSEF